MSKFNFCIDNCRSVSNNRPVSRYRSAVSESSVEEKVEKYEVSERTPEEET